MKHIHGGNIYRYSEAEDFSANINFRGMPEKVEHAALQAVSRSVHYPEPESRSLCGKLAARENVEAENLICGNGAAELLFLLVSAKKPQHAVLAQPCFFEYEQALAAASCEITHLTLSSETDFRIDESFTDRIPQDADLLILGNPNNPTGQLIPADILEQILAYCRERNIFLVMDESFFDFLAEEDRRATIECTEYISRQELFVLKSFTKMYAMPGLRFGYGISGDRALIEQMKQLTQPWNVSLPAQAAAEAAAEELLFARETAERTAQNRKKMYTELMNAGFPVYPSCTNYLLFRGEPDLGERCLERGFLIRDCSNFRGLKPGYFRICIRSEQENERLLEVLKQAQNKTVQKRRNAEE